MKYIEVENGYAEDGLIGGGEKAIRLNNVKVAAGSEIKRGDLICGSSFDGEFALVGSAADASKVLMIAAADVDGETVTSAYAAGIFNRDKVAIGGGSIIDFEQEMRKQNLHLT